MFLSYIFQLRLCIRRVASKKRYTINFRCWWCTIRQVAFGGDNMNSAPWYSLSRLVVPCCDDFSNVPWCSLSRVVVPSCGDFSSVPWPYLRHVSSGCKHWKTLLGFRRHCAVSSTSKAPCPTCLQLAATTGKLRCSGSIGRGALT